MSEEILRLLIDTWWDTVPGKVPLYDLISLDSWRYEGTNKMYQLRWIFGLVQLGHSDAPMS